MSLHMVTMCVFFYHLWLCAEGVGLIVVLAFSMVGGKQPCVCVCVRGVLHVASARAVYVRIAFPPRQSVCTLCVEMTARIGWSHCGL